MPRIKSSAFILLSNDPGTRRFLKSWCGVERPSSRTNEGGDAGVGHAHQIAIVLDCAKDGVGQMLSHHRGWSKVSIVRNIDQHICSFVCEATRYPGMRGFYTNK